MATKKYKFGASNHGAKAIHTELPDGEHQAVGIGNMRVFIVPDGEFWFAQGLEIDYATQGSTVEEAKQNFTTGLADSIDLHLQMHGCIDELLKPSHSEVLQEATRNRTAIHNYSQVSIHDIGVQSQLAFPFGGIDFYRIDKQAA